ncbi:replication endonuclease [Reinekea sp.]|jgi:hypothetical protein|uniref:replication endonuclease n=1 Tax=Reinekea sp. TaxID=1970455 RepID=UPI003989D4DC
MRLSHSQAENKFQSIHREAFGALAADVLTAKRFFAPESVQADVENEISGVRMSDDAIRNVQIRHMAKLAENISNKSKFGNLKWQADDDSASDYCEQKAEKIESILSSYYTGEVPTDWLQRACDSIAVNPFTFYGFFEFYQCQVEVNEILKHHNLEPIDTEQPNNEVLADLLRVTNKDWWFKQWRKQHIRLIDEVARALGHVKKVRAPYISNYAFKHWKKRQFQNYEFMKSTEVENDAGDVYDLHEIAMKGTANRAIRRAELMTRLRGFDILADLKGYKAEFWTITCPSRFHPTTSRKTKRGKSYAVENKNWVEANRPTVREAQQYLSTVWARIRSELKRNDIDWFGFRIAEPHADGCPHWHLVVYVDSSHVSVCDSAVDDGKQNRKAGKLVLGPVASVGRKHALKDSPNEHGANKHRFTTEPIREGINEETGREYSAAGYIAKYISKNIDGYGVEGLEDFDGGGDLKDNAKRVVAWASVHGVRQFQQFGGAPVGLWRELRRLYQVQEREAATAAKTGREYERDEFLTRLFDQTEQEDAAEAWASFCLIHSADPTKFKIICDHRVANVIRMNWNDEGTKLIEYPARRIIPGRYGLPVIAPTGLEVNKKKYCTRPHYWTLQRKAVAPPFVIAPMGADLLLGRASPGVALDLCH